MGLAHLGQEFLYGPSLKAQARVRACCLLPAGGKSQLVLSLQDTKRLPCGDAGILLQSKHIKPDKPFQQGCGKGKHALESTQVTTDVCRRCQGHAL